MLVIDDNNQRSQNLAVILDFLGEDVVTAASISWKETAIAKRGSKRKFNAVFLGDCCQNRSLVERLTEINAWDANAPIVLLGQDQTVLEDGDEKNPDASASSALRKMIVDNLKPPLNYSSLQNTLHRAQSYREALTVNSGKSGKRPSHLFRSLVGASPEIKAIREMMAMVADKEVTVLITGESGTGKEVVARNLHYNSARRDGPFVPVNCGAIPAELLESELFGHEKGAFTGAISARAGRFEMAEGGTLFLDEIGDMPLNMQVKILRVLQERSFERVGASKARKTDVRVIAATHRNLEKMIEQEKFREDLYYRLNVFPIEMPSLRDRSKDIPLLINEQISRITGEGRGSIRFHADAIMSLCNHNWAGNVRELVNLIERMTITHPDGIISTKELPEKYRHENNNGAECSNENGLISSVLSEVDLDSMEAAGPGSAIDLKEYLTSLERNLILQALDECGGVVARAAEKLTLGRTTLVEKIRKYNLKPKTSDRAISPPIAGSDANRI